MLSKAVRSRIFASLVCVAFVFSISGCGGKTKRLSMEVETLRQELDTVKKENDNLHKQVELLSQTVQHLSELNSIIQHGKKEGAEDQATVGKDGKVAK